jgi:MFS family permease
MLADIVSVLLVAVPIGKLGDHHGRRKIMAMALFGVVGSLCEIFTVCTFILHFLSGILNPVCSLLVTDGD